ncbi:hypothetical protein [Streptomyces sp. NPDC003023]|uniref:hypothetical protein n=1 Tax=Streptomyces sp. NPDC003023 TaxID=3364675 RepID=UPI00367B134A
MAEVDLVEVAYQCCEALGIAGAAYRDREGGPRWFTPRDIAPHDDRHEAGIHLGPQALELVEVAEEAVPVGVGHAPASHSAPAVGVVDSVLLGVEVVRDLLDDVSEEWPQSRVAESAHDRTEVLKPQV